MIQKTVHVLDEGQSMENPASTKHKIYGPCVVFTVEFPDGGITITPYPLAEGLRMLAKEVLDQHHILGTEMVNAFGVRQVNTTLLAEAIVTDFNCPQEWLDDETHLLWDAVLDTAVDYLGSGGVQ